MAYDQVGHIPGNAQIWAHMVKPGVWGINVNYSQKLGVDSVNLLSDSGEKESEQQMANFSTNQTVGHVPKTKTVDNRNICVVLGENGPLG